MTLRFGPLRRLSGFAAWTLIMAFMFACTGIVQDSATVQAGAAMLAGLALVDVVVRRRNGGDWPNTRPYIALACTVVGVFAAGVVTVAFLTFPAA